MFVYYFRNVRMQSYKHVCCVFEYGNKLITPVSTWNCDESQGKTNVKRPESRAVPQYPIGSDVTEC